MTITIKKELKSFVKPSDHAVFGPSSADRWMACPGSINLSKDIPSRTSPYAAEGTMAHELCEQLFAEKFYGIPRTDHLAMQMLELPDQGEEMMECAESYVELIDAWLNMPHELGDIIYYGIERGVPIFPEENCYGTADFLIVGTKGCAVIDFKYGRGKNVDANSVQLKLYALGVYNYVEGLPEDYEFNTVIYQPRLSIIPKCATYTLEEMKAFKVEAFEAIQATKKPDAPLVRDSSHCWFCPANQTRDPKLKCPMIKQEQIDLANENFDQFFMDMNARPDVAELDKKRDEALVKLLSLYPLIKQTVESAEEELMHRLEEGEAIEGLMVREKPGRRKWKHNKLEDMQAEIVNAFPDKFPDGKATKVKESLLSMTEVKKIVGKKNADKVDALMVTPMKKELVVQDQKVQEIINSLANYSQMITNGI